MAVRRGLTRFARPAGSLFAVLTVCPTGCASSRTPVRASHTRHAVQHAKKKPVLAYELFLKYGGEAGIRTPDTLPYTHFPGVLLQPLGHLTKLLSRVAGTSANVGKRPASVNKLFKKIVRLDKLHSTCSLNTHKSSFLRSAPHLAGQRNEICYAVKSQKNQKCAG